MSEGPVKVPHETLEQVHALLKARTYNYFLKELPTFANDSKAFADRLEVLSGIPYLFALITKMITAFDDETAARFHDGTMLESDVDKYYPYSQSSDNDGAFLLNPIYTKK